MPLMRRVRVARSRSAVRWLWRGCAAWLFAFLSAPSLATSDCEHAHAVELVREVHIDAATLAELRTLPPLKALAIDAPPLVSYNPETRRHEGNGIDILCFVGERLGVHFEFSEPDRQQPVFDKLRQVQQGQADLILPISYLASRATQGIFSEEFSRSYYAAIGRRDANILLRNASDVAQYRLGYVAGASIEAMLQKVVPEAQLQPYDNWYDRSLFNAVKRGDIDLALYNAHVFTEKRFVEELFDLETKYIFEDFPRSYRFYFSNSPAHERLVEAMNRFLPALDITASVRAHQEGERIFLERYESKRQQAIWLFMVSVVAGLLCLAALLLLWRHRRQLRRFKKRNKQFEQERRALFEEKQKLESLSLTDPLTNVPNRRHFDQRAKIKYAQNVANGTQLSLLIVDVDHFKSVNDHYGHDKGDEYLRNIAAILSDVLARHVGGVARYGGEEFICLLPDTDADTARSIAEAMRRAVEAACLPNETVTPPWVTISIGVATLLHGDPGLPGLLKQADVQLYRAKQQGRNRVCTIIIGK